MKLSRRRFLGGAAATMLAAPFYRLLEREAYAATGTGTARRLVVFFSPNGTVHHLRRPTGIGTFFGFPAGSVLEPLEPIREHLVLVDGLDFWEASNHEGGMRAMLTGNGTAGHATGGRSVDQVVAGAIGGSSRFASLEFGVQTSAWGGGVQTRMSYSGEGAFVTPDDDPLHAWQRLFGTLSQDAQSRSLLAMRRRSILDLARADLEDLHARLGAVEQTKLEAHLASLERVESGLVEATACTLPPTPEVTGGLQDHHNFGAVTKAQIDLMVASLACDMTRVASLQLGHTVSPHVIYDAGVSEGHHTLSHAGDADDAGIDGLRRAERWFAEQFRYLVERLAATSDPETGGTLLDGTLVVWAKEMGDSRLHVCNDVPFVLAGSAGGRFETGRYLRYGGESHTHLLVSICQAMGLSTSTFGNPSYGSGALPGLV
ncbi:MAG: DUF1552 domain-containing protein [Alphaproteobacteria bacterium]|nr:DUF1552 domain-containing protein [Alphaproteobacteria bacterium]